MALRVPLWPGDEAEHELSPTGRAFREARRDAALASTRPQAHTEYQGRMLDWIVERLGVPRHTLVWALNDGYGEHTWDGTEEPLVQILAALDEWQDCGVESATGTGKSYLAACVTLAFLATWEGARVFSFAPKEDQLRLYMWAEVTKLWPRFQAMFPTAELTDLRIRMIPGSDEWGAWGYAVGVRAEEHESGVATKAAGMHAEHMLLIYEETPGIPLPVIRAGENTCTAPHNLRLALGNPDSQQDALHQFCVEPGVVHVRISALDHPNVVTGEMVVGGAVSRASVERRRRKYGPGEPLYESRVRGIAPKQSAHALIRWEWCERAARRWEDPAYRRGPRALGVDVANSEAGDRAAIATWIGACLDEIDVAPCPDANQLGVQVALRMALEGIPPELVGVDSVGVGAGTVNKLKELRQYVRALNGGARAEETLAEEAEGRKEDGRSDPRAMVLMEESFPNLRAQMWWQMRLDLQYDRIALPYDEELFQDLCTPKWEPKNGKIVVESKEAVRARLAGGRSPDKGDAAVYGNWVRQRYRPPEQKPPISAWDAEVLAHEAGEGRRVRSPGPKRGTLLIHPEFGQIA